MVLGIQLLIIACRRLGALLGVGLLTWMNTDRWFNGERGFVVEHSVDKFDFSMFF